MKIPPVRPNSASAKSRVGCDATAGDFFTSMRNKNFSRSCSTAQIEVLEQRRLLNAALLRDGRLTVYCTDNSALAIYDSDYFHPAANLVKVGFHPADNSSGTEITFQFRGAAITRLRILGDGNEITLWQTHTPNLTDVAIYTGDGGGHVQDGTELHPFNRAEQVSIFGGNGNDSFFGGQHTALMDGGAGNDTLSGGEAGATLNGGDGDDVLSANEVDLASALIGSRDSGNALGSIVLNGGAGDDVIVGIDFKLAGVSDTLSGGGGNDAFYPFSADQIVDFGVGNDQNLAANQFSGSAQVTQTATFSIDTSNVWTAQLSHAFPPMNLGNNGPNSKIFASDTEGTLMMRGPNGSTFQLGDLFRAAGYPFGQNGVAISGASFSLTVNGFASPLQGNQIAGYQINDGDVITLTVRVPPPVSS